MSLRAGKPAPPFSANVIKTLIPHRSPMLMLSRVLSLGEQSIVTEHDITAEMPVLAGHFPDMPLMPGVLLAETAAQSAAVLMDLTYDIEAGIEFLALTGIDAAKFRKAVKPGDTVRVELRIAKARRPLFKFESDLFVGETRVAQVAFTANLMKFD
ncbi:3-hydroxyacyl-ACP dehydratase FabZ family protein [Robiginitomaculum antarcticum]|uniref:3-hydroxyacyl-ACP dehydratase FabZ family protein n=1 Tax=Robiginitomaculum antarcticum TaxID=437507 RepID=UPI000374F163|nr:3-hydroxyacyl-ACP dehydratase FabZ family protein [Robiginitomaculum antarcticum]